LFAPAAPTAASAMAEKEEVELKLPEPSVLASPCFVKTYVKGASQREDYFTCDTCKLNWICHHCAKDCHEGHVTRPFQLNALPTFASCSCYTKSGVCTKKAPPRPVTNAPSEATRGPIGPPIATSAGPPPGFAPPVAVSSDPRHTLVLGLPLPPSRVSVLPRVIVTASPPSKSGSPFGSGPPLLLDVSSSHYHDPALFFRNDDSGYDSVLLDALVEYYTSTSPLRGVFDVLFAVALCSSSYDTEYLAVINTWVQQMGVATPLPATTAAATLSMLGDLVRERFRTLQANSDAPSALRVSGAFEQLPPLVNAAGGQGDLAGSQNVSFFQQLAPMLLTESSLFSDIVFRGTLQQSFYLGLEGSFLFHDRKNSRHFYPTCVNLLDTSHVSRMWETVWRDDGISHYAPERAYIELNFRPYTTLIPQALAALDGLSRPYSPNTVNEIKDRIKGARMLLSFCRNSVLHSQKLDNQAESAVILRYSHIRPFIHSSSLL
jgi:hypothetical protein